MSIELEVELDLKQRNGNISQLMEFYIGQQNQILKRYGGNIGDIPVDSDNPYHEFQAKIMILGRLSNLSVKRLEPDELEKKRKEIKEKSKV
jgi:hypothetical protein